MDGYNWLVRKRQLTFKVLDLIFIDREFLDRSCEDHGEKCSWVDWNERRLVKDDQSNNCEKGERLCLVEGVSKWKKIPPVPCPLNTRGRRNVHTFKKNSVTWYHQLLTFDC
jgi:hypothetical protein